MPESMVIIGAGQAGARAAMSLRERGFAGSIVLVGNESHAPYERPPLSKTVMTSAVADLSPAFISDRGKLAEQSIDFFSGVRAVAIDRLARTVSLSQGPALSYSKLLLATGASPRRLDLAGGGEAKVLYLRTFEDALKLRQGLQAGAEIVIVGGGFIGMEIAASATARGCNVTVLEAAPRLLMRGVPEVVATRIAAKHLAAGVAILTSVSIDAIYDRGERQDVRLKDGRVLTCDLIIAGVGAIPETHLATACGLAVANGIRVDGFLQTDDPDILAAGDCCSFPHDLYGGRRIRLEAWRNAQDQGAIAAANMLGLASKYSAVPWFWSDQYDETLQVAGLYDPGCSTVERSLNETASIYFHIDSEGRLIAASAVGVNGVIAREIRMAEMLIGRRARLPAADLANPAFKLKDVLKG